MKICRDHTSAARGDYGSEVNGSWIRDEHRWPPESRAFAILAFGRSHLTNFMADDAQYSPIVQAAGVECCYLYTYLAGG
jgi:hypothetical protein